MRDVRETLNGVAETSQRQLDKLKCENTDAHTRRLRAKSLPYTVLRGWYTARSPIQKYVSRAPLATLGNLPRTCEQPWTAGPCHIVPLWQVPQRTLGNTGSGMRQTRAKERLPKRAEAECPLFAADAVLRLLDVVPVHEALQNSFIRIILSHHGDDTYVGSQATALGRKQNLLQRAEESGIRLLNVSGHHTAVNVRERTGVEKNTSGMISSDESRTSVCS